MRTPKPSRSPRSHGRWAVAPLFVGLGVAALLFVPFAGAAPSWTPDPMSWSNGYVLCVFQPAAPGVAVSAQARSQSGLATGLAGLVEMTPTGQTAGVANLSGATWTVTNASDEDAYDLQYTATASVATPAAPVTTLGHVDVQVDFVLPAYDGSPRGPTDTVGIPITISNWPWQSSADHLELAFGAAPAFLGSEHLLLGSSPDALVSTVSSSTGATYESLGANTSAAGTTATGGTADVTATPQVQGNSTGASLFVSFGTEAGAFSTLQYESRVTVQLPTTVLGIPVIDLVAVGTAAVIAAVLVAVGVRRVRKSASDLTYVDEEEP